MSAKEFKEKEGYGNFWKNELEIDEDYIFEFAEAYHKSKIEAISDEDIEANGIEGGLRDGELQMFWEGATWFKRQLLKQ